MINVDDRIVQGEGIETSEELAPVGSYDNFKMAMGASFDKFTMTSQMNSSNRYYSQEFDKRISELKTDDPEKQKYLDTYKGSTNPNKSLFERLDKEGKLSINEDGTLSATDPYSKHYAIEFKDQIKGYFYAKDMGLNTDDVRLTVNNEIGKKVKETEETLRKSKGFSSVVGEFLGTAGGFVTDPFQLATIPLGVASVGRGIAGNAIKSFGQEFVINAVTETATQGVNYEWKQDLGMKHDLADAFYEVAVAGVAGGAIRAGGSVAVDTFKLSRLDWNKEAFKEFERTTYGTKTNKQADVLQAIEKVYDDKAEGRAVNVEHVIDDKPTSYESPQAHPQGKTVEEVMETIRQHDKGGEAQAQAYKAQMEAWAKGENIRRQEAGLEPTITADDMSLSHSIEYFTPSKPKQDELDMLLDTVSDTQGNIKTIEQRGKSHGWQDVTSKDKYGQEYTTRMAGERGLDNEIITDVKTLNKLKKDGYDALSDTEKAMVDRDIDTIRNHPDFQLKEPKLQEPTVHVNEAGELVDEDGNYLFQTSSRLKEWHKDSHPLTKNEDGTPKVFYHGSPYDISSFKNGNYDFIYFTESPKYAERYAFGNDKVGGIYPTYIKANKIFDTRNPKDRAIFEKEFYMKYGNATKLDTKTGLPDWVEAKELKEFFEDKGYKYDGVMLSETPDNVGNGISLGVLNPTQIKSIHNKGTFSETDPNILAQSAKGVYKVDEKLIQVFRDADYSTINHELGHRFLFTLNNKEREVASQIFGAKDGKWTVENHEVFADAYARYLATGKTTNKGLKAIFKKFKEFTMKILDALKENNNGKMPELSKDAKAFFDATMGDVKARKELFNKLKAQEDVNLNGKSMWAKADEEFTTLEMPPPEKVKEIVELGYNTEAKADMDAIDMEIQNLEKGLAECL